MKHVEAGFIMGVAFLFAMLMFVGLIHFVGWGAAGIIILAAVIVGIGAAVIDYLTEER